MREGLPEDQINAQGPKPMAFQLISQKNWWRIGLLATLGLFLATAGVVGFYVLKAKKVEEGPQPTQVHLPSPAGTTSPTPEQIVPTPTPMTPLISPSPTGVIQNYPRPSSWKIVTIPSMGISLCLPPKWAVSTDHYLNDYREIFFERDPGYRPRATSVSKIPYTGGSRREEYINSKVQYEYDPEKLRIETIVKEVIINGRSVLDIAIPFFSEELVFVLGDFLYAVDVDYEPLVNDSRSAFQKDIYTIVGCLESI